jgi:adenylate cyclase
VDIAVAEANCLKAYSYFSATLEGRRDYYETTYGFVPEFKAGINLGRVTVVEVGVLKRAIVYHSDVLNTAARVQALCNEHGKTLLITDAVKEKLAGSAYRFEFIGDVVLRGKTQPVGVYSLE